MDDTELPFSKKRLYVAEWSSRALHGTAMMMNRLRMEQDLSERQEWLYDRIIDELEWRWLEDTRLRPWQACSCSLCWAPFPSDHLHHDSDDGGDALPQSRPDGQAISRHSRKRPAEG